MHEEAFVLLNFKRRMGFMLNYIKVNLMKKRRNMYTFPIYNNK